MAVEILTRNSKRRCGLWCCSSHCCSFCLGAFFMLLLILGLATLILQNPDAFKKDQKVDDVSQPEIIDDQNLDNLAEDGNVHTPMTRLRKFSDIEKKDDSDEEEQKPKVLLAQMAADPSPKNVIKNDLADESSGHYVEEVEEEIIVEKKKGGKTIGTLKTIQKHE